jgi:peptidoglycan/LPS O-acetylase OafA/YrhL
VRSPRIPVAFAAVIGLVFITAWLMGWSAERAIYLAPVIVIGFAAAAGLVILWGKVALQQLRETRRPRLVLALWLLAIGLIVLLSILGVELPREG